MRNLNLNSPNKRSTVPTRTWRIRYENADGEPMQEVGFLTREQAVHRLHEVGEQIDNQIRQKYGEAVRSERA